MPKVHIFKVLFFIEELWDSFIEQQTYIYDNKAISPRSL